MKIRKTSKQNAREPSYKDLHDAWWCIYNALKHIKPNIVRDYFVRITFESLLEQCNWKIEEWNELTLLAKKKGLE